MGRPDQRGQLLHLQEPIEEELNDTFKMIYDVPLALVRIPNVANANALAVADYCVSVADTRALVADAVGPSYEDVDNIRTPVLGNSGASNPVIFGSPCVSVVFSRAKNGATSADYIGWANSAAGEDSNRFRVPFDARILMFSFTCAGASTINKATTAVDLRVNGSTVKSLVMGVSNYTVDWRGNIAVSARDELDIRLNEAAGDSFNSPVGLVLLQQASR